LNNELLADDYLGGTLSSDPEGGASIALHYATVTSAETAFDYLTDAINNARTGDIRELRQ